MYVWLVVRTVGVCGCVRSVCMVGSKEWVCVGVCGCVRSVCMVGSKEWVCVGV